MRRSILRRRPGAPRRHRRGQARARAGARARAMTRIRAALGSAVFFALAPGVVAGVVPWLLTHWHAHHWWTPLRVAGVLLILTGVPVLVQAFIRFVVEGVGTPAPVAPTTRLVTGGLYRYVRNPMYIAVAATIL